MRIRKSIIGLSAVAALAVPSAAMAGQPVDPGGFGQERAANIQTYFTNDGYGTWGNAVGIDGASDRAGDNGTINQDWRESHSDFMPTH